MDCVRLQHPSVTDSVGTIFSPGFPKNVTGSVNFPPGCPFLSSRCVVLFKRTQMIYGRYAEVAPGKPQTGRVKLKISPGTGEAKFALGRVSLGLLQRGVFKVSQFVSKQSVN